MSDRENPWDFGILLSKDGEIIPPGACDGYHTNDGERPSDDG